MCRQKIAVNNLQTWVENLDAKKQTVYNLTIKLKAEVSFKLL